MQWKIHFVPIARMAVYQQLLDADGTRAHYFVVVQLRREWMKREHRAAASLFPFSYGARGKSIREFWGRWWNMWGFRSSRTCWFFFCVAKYNHLESSLECIRGKNTDESAKESVENITTYIRAEINVEIRINVDLKLEITQFWFIMLILIFFLTGVK